MVFHETSGNNLVNGSCGSIVEKTIERIAPVLTAAIQEQQKQIEELKAEIEKLKSK